MPEKGRAKDRRRSMTKEKQKSYPDFQQEYILIQDKKLSTECSSPQEWVDQISKDAT